jgi:Fur family ferric uptake transcriptional regulator
MKNETVPLDPAAWLKKNHLRLTVPRSAIVRLLDSSDVPLTLADIHEKVRETGCDFATVFRFITELEKRGLVEKMAWADGSTRHEIRAAGHNHHHHYLICRTCQKVEPIDHCVVKELEDQISKERGYTAVSHQLQLSGVCPSCQSKAG